MRCQLRAAPRRLVHDIHDDQVGEARGCDRSPKAAPAMALWLGTQTTDIAIGEHVVDARASRIG
jgi:hypothetical protein